MSYHLQTPRDILCLKSSLMVLRNLDAQQTTATCGSSPQQVNLRAVDGGREGCFFQSANKDLFHLSVASLIVRATNSDLTLLISERLGSHGDSQGTDLW